MQIGRAIVFEKLPQGFYLKFFRNEVCWARNIGFTVSYYSHKLRAFRHGQFRAGLVRD